MGLEEGIDRRSLSQKLWWLILGRVVSVVLLFLGRVLWIRGNAGLTRPETWRPLVIIGCLSTLYALAHRFSRALLLQARVQFVIDILLVTWLLQTSDVIHSPYVALYIVIIAASSLFLGPRDAIVNLRCLRSRFYRQRARCSRRLWPKRKSGPSR